MNKGRHTKPDAIVRVGKQVLFWLTIDDKAKLEAIAKKLGRSQADSLRQLIREFSLEE